MGYPIIIEEPRNKLTDGILLKSVAREVLRRSLACPGVFKLFIESLPMCDKHNYVMNHYLYNIIKVMNILFIIDYFFIVFILTIKHHVYCMTVKSRDHIFFQPGCHA